MQKRKVKILATLGPASNNKAMITRLLKAGVNGFRLNFSHGEHKGHEETYKKVRAAAEKLNIPVAVVADLQGPKIRVGDIPEPVMLKKGQTIDIASGAAPKGSNALPCTYAGLAKDAKKGDRVLIDDGLIELRVISKSGKIVTCKVVNGGMVQKRKGINLPGVDISASSITAKDVKDLKFALNLGVDYIAVSFVRTGKGLRRVKKLVDGIDSSVQVIAKIEKPEALANLDEIIAESDGLMVARGDLAVETCPEDVPVLQKGLLAEANLAGKLDVVATQMLDSMVNNQTPTRAEASDVANAVIDGADVVMLSQETAIGKHPVKVVKMMERIINSTAGSCYFERHSYIPNDDDVSLLNGITHAAALAADETKASALVVYSLEGKDVQMLSNIRPEVKIVAVTPDKRLYNQFSLLYGVQPVMSRNYAGIESVLDNVEENLKQKRILKKGQTFVFLAGNKRCKHILHVDTVE